MRSKAAHFNEQTIRAVFVAKLASYFSDEMSSNLIQVKIKIIIGPEEFTVCQNQA